MKVSSGRAEVLIITGFAPVGLRELDEMGTNLDKELVAGMVSDGGGIRISIPTIGPAVLGRYLLERGVDVRIRDYYLDEGDEYDAPVIGISSTFMGIDDVKEIARLARERNPEAKIVLGGPLSWSVPSRRLMEIIPGLDYIVLREGESTFFELVTQLHCHGSVNSVCGLVGRTEDGVFETPARPSLEASELVGPAWELLGIPSPCRLPVLPVETSRGCPYGCAYCSEVHYWGKPVRYRSKGDVVKEIRHNVDRFGISTFRFTDSCFSAPVSRSGELCDALHHEFSRDGTGLQWTSYARVENLKSALLEKMKRSGCVALDIGVESGASDILSGMRRGYSPRLAIDVARMAREVGILTNFNIVVGFPGETEETVKQTIEIIDEAGPDTFACFLLFVAPNSLAHSNPEEYGIHGEGLRWTHRTMNSEQASEAMSRISREVTGSVSLPGGEYIACYLASVGYSVTKIRNLYRAVSAMQEDPSDGAALGTITEAMEAIGSYF